MSGNGNPSPGPGSGAPAGAARPERNADPRRSVPRSPGPTPMMVWVAPPPVEARAIVGLVLGGVSLVTVWLWLVALILGLTSIVLCESALRKVRRSEGRLRGRELAIAGMTCGFLGSIGGLLALALRLLLAVSLL